MTRRHPGLRMSMGVSSVQRSGIAPGAVIPGALAGILTVTDLVVVLRYEIDPVWVWLQLPVVLLAWAAPVAWQQRRWGLAGIGLLAMLGGLWGYLYLPPLAAVVLAVVALGRLRST